AVVISGFVAVTISPMMAGHFLKPHEEESPNSLVARIDRAFDWLSVRYSRALSASLDSRPVVLAIVVAIFGTLVFMFMHTKSELAPSEDQGALFALVTGPRYATSTYTKHYVDQFDAAIGPIPETNRQFSIVGFGGGASGG